MSAIGKQIANLEDENKKLRDVNERMMAALEPFAAIGSFLFALPLPDETPVVEIGTISGRTALTRGHFKEPCPGCGSVETMNTIRDRGFVSCCPDRPVAPSYIEIGGIVNAPPSRS